jgi:hypothetical protein
MPPGCDDDDDLPWRCPLYRSLRCRWPQWSSTARPAVRAILDQEVGKVEALARDFKERFFAHVQNSMVSKTQDTVRTPCSAHRGPL